MRTIVMVVVGLVIMAFALPSQWYPDRLRFELADIMGAPKYSASGVSAKEKLVATEAACPEDLLGFRNAQVIEGVSISASANCVGDNPYALAAFVKGTNNVSADTLMRAGLSADALEKGRDLDGDGDADEIHIRLEVAELNGGSPDSQEPTNSYALAPGITPGLWVFVPKSFGMATENFESNVAMPLLRLPSPSIRVEQGDRVFVTLENTHYMPHTIHFHGVDHAYMTADGQGNEGVPMASEMPLAPGEARTYELQPRSVGTSFYHCHVQTQTHLAMGLQGMFIVEENRPNNQLQSMNIGAGQVRVRSQESIEKYDQEYDMHYTDLDHNLNNIVQRTNDPERIKQWLHGGYNITEGRSHYFALNGRSFPYSFRESLVVVEPDQQIRLRVLNAGSEGVALHTHGHKTTATHYDGVAVSPIAQITRDVFWLASAQRLDLTLSTVNDGTHSYGAGVWMMHDHKGRGITNNGIAPGGNMTAIVYEDFISQEGWPITQGEDFGQYFNPEFYRRDEASEAAIIRWKFLLRIGVVGAGFAIFMAGISRAIIALRSREKITNGVV
jgi:plastocyanin